MEYLNRNILYLPDYETSFCLIYYLKNGGGGFTLQSRAMLNVFCVSISVRTEACEERLS